MKRTEAVKITAKTRLTVSQRDGGLCIFCGFPGLPEAHVVNRSQGGLGVPENIVTVCRKCHNEMDNGKRSKIYREEAEAYLKRHYPGWSREKVKYHKGETPQDV